MSAVGRADLLRAWDERGKAGLAAMARLLDFEERRRGKPAWVIEHPSIEWVPSPTPAPDSKLAPIPYWFLAEIGYLEPAPAPSAPSTDVRPIGLSGIGSLPGSPPSTPPLASDARLMPALRRRLGSDVPSREVDVDALAERWSRGLALRRLPFRPLSAWSPKIVVLLDRAARLIPFWDDQDRLLLRLRRRLGHAALHEVFFLEDYALPWRSGRLRLSWLPLVPGVPVLVLGDLGFLGGKPERAHWRSLGERLRSAGVPCCALVPCPAGRWQPEAARIWDPVEWERPAGAPRFGRARSEAARRRRAERLLGLAAFASRIESGLLRAVRRLLPLPEADAGTEADAWNHPGMTGGFAPAGSPEAELRGRRFVSRPRPTPSSARPWLGCGRFAPVCPKSSGSTRCSASPWPGCCRTASWDRKRSRRRTSCGVARRKPSMAPWPRPRWTGPSRRSCVARWASASRPQCRSYGGRRRV